MHRLTDSILNIGNAFQNKNVTIHERFCVSPPPYYLDWFEKYFPNVTLNQDDGTFTLKYTNGIQGKNPSGRQWNRLLDEVVTVMKYKRIVMESALRYFQMVLYPISQYLPMMLRILPIT